MTTPRPRTRRTLVFLHAHPDDESLLTAGTMARAAAEGQRVVLVVATDGSAGLASAVFGGDNPGELAAVRARELDRSAAALGVARVVRLGFGDSGLRGEEPVLPGHPVPLARAPMAEVVDRVVEVCEEERADILVGYDPTGGYGHPDHVRVHALGRAAAAALTRPPRLFEATINRDWLARGVRAADRIYPFPASFDVATFAAGYTAGEQITHRIDVRRYWRAKRASMAAHASQASAEDGDRTLAAFLRIPPPLFRLVFGTEWFVAVG